MSERVGRVLAIVRETRERVNETRSRIQAMQAVFEKNLATYIAAQAPIQRPHEQPAWFTIRRDAPPRNARQLHLVISMGIDAGRLPDTASRTALVSGFAGKCEACDGNLPSMELVKAIQRFETFVYLHADCYATWQSQCRLRAVLRRYKSVGAA